MAVRVKILNNHVLGKKGSIIDVPIPKASYLIRCKVAEKHIEPKPKKKTVKTKKENDGLNSANSKTKPKH